jgi:hypothetical protein
MTTLIFIALLIAFILLTLHAFYQKPEYLIVGWGFIILANIWAQGQDIDLKFQELEENNCVSTIHE